jgi:1,2-diacylglycerol 3-alpha-glucosyltransferase
MRILMTSHGYPPTLSGVTLVVQKLARALVRKGHEVMIITGSELAEPYEDEDEGVHLVRVRSVPNPFWEEAPLPFVRPKRLQEMIAEFQPDILHVHEPALLAMELVRLKQDLGLPLLASCYYVPRFITHYLTWMGQSYEGVETVGWLYSIWLYNQFDHVVFSTSAQRRFFLDKGLDVPTTIISNGVDTTRYHPANGQTSDVEARYGLPPRPRILFVSRLAKDKEIDILIQAMPQVLAEKEAHLLLVGRGDDRPRLEDLTKELGLQEFVHFLGFVPEEDLPALYWASDLFAIASTCEVQSLPTLQALATCLPVVAVDALALPELVYDGQNGFLVPPGDPKAIAKAILDILGDSDLAARMGQVGLVISQPHAEKHTFELYEGLYRQMLSAQPGWEFANIPGHEGGTPDPASAGL